MARHLTLPLVGLAKRSSSVRWLARFIRAWYYSAVLRSSGGPGLQPCGLNPGDEQRGGSAYALQMQAELLVA